MVRQDAFEAEEGNVNTNNPKSELLRFNPDGTEFVEITHLNAEGNLIIPQLYRKKFIFYM